MKSTKLLIVSLLLLALFGAALFFTRHLVFEGVSGTYEEAALNRADYQDRWISYEVIACLGEYAEETETQYFIPTGHAYYYVIWMADGSIMPLSVSKKADREYLDALTDATYAYIDGTTKMIEMEPRTFVGTISSQEREAVQYYNEALGYMDISTADGWTVRYELMDCTQSRGGYIALISIVMLLPVGGLIIFFRSYAKEKKKKLNPEMDYLPR